MRTNHKKGEVGFIVTNWNHHGTIGPSERFSELEMCIKHVQVHSCGKKQMKLIYLEDNADCSGDNWSPETIIYAACEEALAACTPLHAIVVADSITNANSRGHNAAFEGAEYTEKWLLLEKRLIADPDYYPLRIIIYGEWLAKRKR